jgi:diketogulonate reductase-like aldo/keto reductase
MPLSRRTFMATAGLLAALPAVRAAEVRSGYVVRKSIPSSGEMLPAIGLEAAHGYQGANTPEALAPLLNTVSTFLAAGGSVIDTSPAYGDAQAVLGRLLATDGLRSSVFLATKVDAEGKEAGQAQIAQSFQQLRTDRIDLITVHNMRDVAVQLQTLRALKAEGRIRYVGVAASMADQYDALAELIAREPLDFVQVDYALDHRAAAQRVLPAAQTHGVAVLVNRPFGSHRTFHAAQAQPLPAWAADIDALSWAQFFLKYAVAPEAVICAAPDTATVAQAEDNAGALRGRLPDADQRRQMEALIDAQVTAKPDQGGGHGREASKAGRAA